MEKAVGWLVGFNVGLGQDKGLLPTVWDPFQKMMILRHAITILIRHGVDDSPAFVPPQIKAPSDTRFRTPSEMYFRWKLGGHYPRYGFYLHQGSLAYMAVLLSASLEPKPSGMELSALPTGSPLPGESRLIIKLNFILTFITPFKTSVTSIIFCN